MKLEYIIFLGCICHLPPTSNAQDIRRSNRRYSRDEDHIRLDTSLFLRESPHFGLPIQTVTVNVGQTARLTCFVQNLGDYEVAWMNKGTNAVLSMGETVITKDIRISVQREQRSTWILTITNVTLQDHGYYTCNINTQPPTSIQGFLNVVEPPVLEDGDEEEWVMEGMPAFLSCMARGTPAPTYKWIREDYNTIRINSSTFVSNWLGRNLTLFHTNHRSAGGYLCIASNGFPPSVSKRVMLYVYFAPIVRGPGMEIRSSIGQSVSLTCLYAAHPSPAVVWIRDNDLGVQQLSKEYFTVTPQDGHPPYTHNMTLKMRRLVHSDFGTYTCVITNSQGEASYTTILSEVITTRAPVTTTTRQVESNELFPKLSEKGTTSQTVHSYNNYDDETKNLSAPLIINMKPDIYREETGVQPAPSREQPYSNRKSKNIARINILDTDRGLNCAIETTTLPLHIIILFSIIVKMLHYV